MKFISDSFPIPIEFQENQVEVLIIENPSMLYSTLSDFKDQADGGSGGWSVYVDDEIKPFNKNVEVITDLFSLDINQKKLLNRLNANIEREIIENNQEAKWFQAYNEFCRAADAVVELNGYNIGYREEVGLKDLVKLMGFEFKSEAADPIELLYDYICIVKDVFDIDTFVIYDIKSFTPQDKLKKFYKSICYNKLNILLLENHETATLPEEHVTIIDYDRCIIDKSDGCIV